MRDNMESRRRQFDTDKLEEWDQVHTIATLLKEGKAKIINQNGGKCTVLKKS